MTTDLVATNEADEALVPQFHAVAVNATEMKAANEGIKTWLRAKVGSIDAEIIELEAQLESARKHKWKTSTFQGILQRARQKRLYYGKILAASEAGFTIVPNMDVDVFAIRVKRDYPKAKDAVSAAETYHPSPRIDDEVEDQIPSGEGRYVSPSQTITTQHDKTINAKGIELKRTTVSAVDFAEIEFPLAVAHSVVMDATARALAMKIFDRVGMVRNGYGDPIVLGQITRKQGWQLKTASFLIAWYLDPRTL